MKYLKKKDIYLNERFDMSGESSGPLGNDINWGDSLVGRLFSSISRRFGVNYNLNKISNITDSIKTEFDNMIATSAVENNDEKDEFNFFKISYLLGELKNIIDNDESEDKILEHVENLVDFLSETKDFENDKAGLKKELEDSLSNFEEYLKSIQNIDDIEDKEDEVSKDIKNKLEKVNKDIDSMGDELKDIHKNKSDDIDAEVEKIKKEIGKILFKEEKDVTKSENVFLNFFNKIFSIKDKNMYISLVKKIKELFNNDKTNESSSVDGDFITEFSNSLVRLAKLTLNLNNKKIGNNLEKHIKSFNKNIKDIIDIDLERKLKFENRLMKYDTFMMINEKSTNKKIKETFYSNVILDNWVVDENKAEDIKQTVENSSKNVKKIDIDPVLNIVKLFNRAFKVYTTLTIPSGRTDGKVSNRVFRRYTNLSGSTGTPQRPGVGPFKINKVFDKFESEIQDIIKDERYKVIFNKDTEVELGDGRKVKGGGKILLNFIQSLLDGSTLYNGNAQNKFFKEYFGLTVADNKIGTDKIKKETNLKDKDVKNDDDSNTEDRVEPKKDNQNSIQSPNANAPKNDNGKIIAEFKEVNKVENLDGSFYGMLSDKDIFYYLMVITSEERYTYVKFSPTFLNFREYLKDNFIVERGDIKNIELNPKNIYFGKIDEGVFDIEKEEKFNMSFLDLLKFNTNNENIKPDRLKDTYMKRVFQLLDKDNNPIQMLDINKTFYGPNDSKNYKALVKKLN